MAIIKRQQHNMKLAQVLNNMLQCGSLVDVTIYCDDGQVNAHKLVLAASSTYFRNLFGRMTNAFQYPIIVLREMPVDDLKTIIQFIYHGEVNVPQNRVDSLMRCANYLQIDGMSSSANSLNAILASSSNMPTGSSGTTLASSHHQPLLSTIAHPLGTTLSASGTNTSLMTTTNQAIMGKLHSQYPPNLSNQMTTAPMNSKPVSRRRNNTNSNNNNLMASNSSVSHQTNNSGKPKHTCSVCFKTFTHGFTLKRHMELHSSSRTSIFCEVCSKSYSCKDSYLRHKKSSGHMQHAEFHHRPIDMNPGR